MKKSVSMSSYDSSIKLLLRLLQSPPTDFLLDSDFDGLLHFQSQSLFHLLDFQVALSLHQLECIVSGIVLLEEVARTPERESGCVLRFLPTNSDASFSAFSFRTSSSNFFPS